MAGEAPEATSTGNEAPASGFGGMKIKGVKRKAALPAATEVPDKMDMIVAIGSNGVQSLNPTQKRGPKIITPLANSWQLHGSRKKPTASPVSTGEVATDAKRPQTLDEEALAALAQDAKRRNGKESDTEAQKMVIEGGGITGTETAAGSQLGAKMQALHAEAADPDEPDLTAKGGIVNEDEKYRADVAWRPQEADVNDSTWEAMPIAQFGSALLRGMGWKPGKGIGLNAKGAATAIEYVPRNHRLGLGATPKAPEPQKKGWINKPGEHRGPKDEMIYQNADGVQKHKKTVDEKLVKRETMGVGAVIAIVAGRHRGLEGVVQSIQEMSGMCQVRLRNDEEVSVAGADVELLSKWLREQQDREAAAEKDTKRDRDRDRDRGRDRDRDRDRGRDKEKHAKHKSKKSGGGGGGGGGEIWAAPGLRVRIISQSYCEGRYYNKKAVVQDVLVRARLAICRQRRAYPPAPHAPFLCVLGTHGLVRSVARWWCVLGTVETGYLTADGKRGARRGLPAEGVGEHRAQAGGGHRWRRGLQCDGARRSTSWQARSRAVPVRVPPACLSPWRQDG
jgi:hypothetical protein